MCGIVGALVFENASFRVTVPYITRMRDVMTHRGPDGAGVWVATDGRVGLGHRRLSIIDLSDRPPNRCATKTELSGCHLTAKSIIMLRSAANWRA